MFQRKAESDLGPGIHDTVPEHLFPALLDARILPKRSSSFIGKGNRKQGQELIFHIPNYKNAKNVHSFP